MQELIFFAVIIVFSILESIARGRKKRAGESSPTPGEWEPEVESEDWEEERPELDPARAREEAGSRGTVAPGRELSTYSAPQGGDASRVLDRGSEAMIPAEIWEEIAGLAGGRGAGAPTRPAPGRPARVERTPLPMPSSGTRGPPRAEHRVHLAHAAYGTDPSTRPRSEQDALDPLARRLSRDAAQVRSVLSGSGGYHALRQAVILHEVLGLPVALRDRQ